MLSGIRKIQHNYSNVEKQFKMAHKSTVHRYPLYSPYLTPKVSPAHSLDSSCSVISCVPGLCRSITRLQQKSLNYMCTHACIYLVFLASYLKTTMHSSGIVCSLCWRGLEELQQEEKTWDMSTAAVSMYGMDWCLYQVWDWGQQRLP